MNRTALSLTPGMSDKGDSGHEESDEGEDILDYNSILRCRICCQYYRKPRILPCGHTFCEECLIQLRDKTSREWRIKFPLRNKHGDGGTLHCQAPGCRYSMKLMNLTRWAPRNRVASAALKVFQRNGAAKTTATPKTSDESLDALDSRPHQMNNKISITTANVTNGQIMSKVEYKNHNNNQIAIAMQLRHSTRHGAAAPGCCDKEEGNSIYSTIIYEAIVQSGFGATKIIHVPPKIVQNWRSFAFVVGLQAIGECFSFQ